MTNDLTKKYLSTDIPTHLASYLTPTENSLTTFDQSDEETWPLKEHPEKAIMETHETFDHSDEKT